jgi:hypothetical protein
MLDSNEPGVEVLEAWQYLFEYPDKLAGWTLEHLWIIFAV